VAAPKPDRGKVCVPRSPGVALAPVGCMGIPRRRGQALGVVASVLGSLFCEKPLVHAAFCAAVVDDIGGDVEGDRDTPSDRWPECPIEATALSDVDGPKKDVDNRVYGDVPHHIGTLLGSLPSPIFSRQVGLITHLVLLGILLSTFCFAALRKSSSSSWIAHHHNGRYELTRPVIPPIGGITHAEGTSVLTIAERGPTMGLSVSPVRDRQIRKGRLMSLRDSPRLLLASCLLVTACAGQTSGAESEPTVLPTTTTSIANSTTLAPTTTATTTTTLAPPAVISTQDLTYAIGSRGDTPVEWKADLHEPTEPGDWPALVFLPGQGLGPNSVYGIAEEIAAHGVAVLVMDYADRGPPELFMSDARGYREAAELLGCGIRFVRHSVEEAGGESGALAVGGHSMGGAPAAHAALAGESLEQLWDDYSTSRDLPRLVECVAEPASTHVDAFVGVAGAYDAFVGYEGLYGLEYIQARNMQLWELLNGAIGLNPDLRVRLLHSREDDLIPIENSEAFVTVLNSAGIPVELTEFEGPHSTLPHDQTVAAVLDILGVTGLAGS